MSKQFKVFDGYGNLVNTIVADDEYMLENFHGVNYEEIVLPDPVIPPPPVPRQPALTHFEFLTRFTADERKAIRVATKTDDDVEDAYNLFMLAQEIDTTHPMTVAYVNMLASKNLLGPIIRAGALSRVDEILGT